MKISEIREQKKTGCTYKQIAALSAPFFLLVLLLLSAGLAGCGILSGQTSNAPDSYTISYSENPSALDLSQIPPWSEDPWIRVNENRPFFTEEEITALFSEGVQSFEKYGELDALGRCTGAFACVGPDLMPEGEREPIYDIKPTGWHIVKYDGIDGNYLYNRCHLIAFGLTGENANERNLITGTRYMNTAGMNDFENETIAYIRRTGNHVLYRVTPIFRGNDLVASGVLMEALSVEDSGLAGTTAKYLPGQTKPGICFCVYAYNVQPGVTINYATGDSTGSLFTGTDHTDHSVPRQQAPSGNTAPGTSSGSMSGSFPDSVFIEPAADVTYVINIYSGKFHRPDCLSVRDMKQHNRRDFTGTREELIAKGYVPCGSCRP